MGISNDNTDVPDEGHADDSHTDMPDDKEAIQLKPCPRCKTPIRRSLRYGNVIKQQLHDIEKVKAKLLLDSSELWKKKDRFYSRGNKLSALVATDWQQVTKSILKMKSKWMAAIIENRLTLLERFLEIWKKMRSILSKVSPGICTEKNLQREFYILFV